MYLCLSKGTICYYGQFKDASRLLWLCENKSCTLCNRLEEVDGTKQSLKEKGTLRIVISVVCVYKIVLKYNENPYYFVLFCQIRCTLYIMLVKRSSRLNMIEV